MVLVLEALGIRTESHHHEVGGPGQGEIDLRFLPLLEMADALQLHKYVVKNTAKQAGKTATFMPKPIFEENGSGMHVHQSLWKNGETLMHAAGGYALLSPLALHYAAGLLEHAKALFAFCAPTTNSYRRLVPGYEAPVLLKHSQRNRSAAVRIPMYSPSAEGQADRVPPAGPAREPIPGVRRDADGRIGRDPSASSTLASRSIATSTSCRPSSSPTSRRSRPRSTRRSTRSRPTTRSSPREGSSRRTSSRRTWSSGASSPTA